MNQQQFSCKKQETGMEGEIVSDGQTQAQIEKKMQEVVGKTPEIFKWAGKS